MLAHSFAVEYTYGEVVRIACITDAHMGAKWCDEKALAKDITRLTDEPKTQFLFLGDLMDSIVCTDKRYRPSGHVEPGLDNVIDYEVDRVAEMFSPCRGRIIGSLTGNHEDTITARHGTNPAARIAKKLDAPYLGYSTIIKLCLYEKGEKRNGRYRTVYIYAHHGHGGGARTAGGSITTLDRNRTHIEADAYLFGHVHQLRAVRQVVLAHSGKTTEGQKIIAKKQVVGICGTYLRGYSNGVSPTYAEIKAYPPSELGCLVLNIKPEREGYDMWAET